jgi:hypothetical protein
MESLLPYLLNCFLFFIPVFVWNLIFFRKLPAGYQKPAWDNVPKPLAVLENVLRIIAFISPVFLKIEFSSVLQRAGAIFYGFGIAVYFSSWLIVIRRPDSRWSKSAVGFTAPAWTTAAWLGGIGLVGRRTIIPGLPYSFIVYLSITIAFVCVHTTHACLAFRNRKR